MHPNEKDLLMEQREKMIVLAENLLQTVVLKHDVSSSTYRDWADQLEEIAASFRRDADYKDC